MISTFFLLVEMSEALTCRAK